MNARHVRIAAECLEASETDARPFPETVGILMSAGFEGYQVDFRRARTTYYMQDGAAFDLPMHASALPVAAAFDTAAIQSAIREAQQQVPGYTYLGFCRKVIAAGCAGYTVSFSGRRAVYHARSGESHVEHFPS